jgi:hypothetical protein
LVIEILGEGGQGEADGLYHRIAGEAIAELAKPPKSCVTALLPDPAAGDPTMIYVLAALLPPLGLLLNGQPFAAIFNLVLIVFCAIFGLIFHVLLLVPSAHALIAVHMKREDRRHREVVEAIRRHGPPPGYPR